MEKTPGEIIILHKCTKNHDYIPYCSWDMACNRWCNCFFILGYFLPFYPWKIKQHKKSKLKKIKNHLEISPFYQKSWSYAILFRRYGIWQINYFSFWAIFCLFTLLTAQKIKILKKIKNLEISSSYIYVPKIMIRWCMVPEIWCATARWTDRWMDRQKKCHIEVGAPPKKVFHLLIWLIED